MANDVEFLIEATSRLVKRAGASQFRMLRELNESVIWTAIADFGDLGVRVGRGYSPAYACLRLATELLDGTTCRRCNHVIAVNGSDEHFCQWRYCGGDFRPGCGLPVNKDVAMLPGQV